MSYNLGDSLEVFGFFYPLEIRPPGVMCLKRTLDFEVQAQIVGLVSLDRRNLEICGIFGLQISGIGLLRRGVRHGAVSSQHTTYYVWQMANH